MKILREEPSFHSPTVAMVFAAYPPAARTRLFALRRLIFTMAASTPGVGALEETLRWGEPTYLTSQSGSGSMVRIAWKKSRPDHYEMNFHCQTSLVSSFRRLYPREFHYAGDRSLIFDVTKPLPSRAALRCCIRMALTYRRATATSRSTA